MQERYFLSGSNCDAIAKRIQELMGEDAFTMSVLQNDKEQCPTPTEIFTLGPVYSTSFGTFGQIKINIAKYQFDLTSKIDPIEFLINEKGVQFNYLRSGKWKTVVKLTKVS